MKKFVELMLSLALLTGILTGCGDTTPDSNTAAPDSSTPVTQTEISEVTSSTDAEESAWPRTIVDSLGKEITLEKKPERVAIIDFGFMETMFALGVQPIASSFAERSLYGFGTLQPYAADAQIEELGEAKAPNLEKLVELAPDLIFTTSEEEHLAGIKYEETSQITTVVAFDSDDWKEQLRAFAEVLGEEERAEAYISEIETLIVDSREKLTGYSDKTVVLMFERSSDIGNFYITGFTETPVWFDEENGLGLTFPEGYPETGQLISLEGVAELDPDYIFLFGTLGTEANGYQQNYLSEETQATTVWQSLSAVKNGNLYYLDAAVRAGGPLSIKLGIETIVESMTK